MGMKHEDLHALIRLLDDPDEEVFRMVSEKLTGQGIAVVPMLEKAWEMTMDEAVQSRIEMLIQQIQFNLVADKLRKWSAIPDNDLFEGVYLLAKYQYPDLKQEPLKSSLEKIAREVWLEFQDNLTALEKVKILNHILFEENHFGGNHANFYAPQNNFINVVLETRKGSPISLSVVYALVARELKLPVFGVNLPKHFILAYRDEQPSEDSYDPEINDHILFYINPYNRGAVLGKAELDSFLNQQGIAPLPDYFVPCSNKAIVGRMINNLVHSYRKLGYREKLDELEDLMEAIK